MRLGQEMSKRECVRKREVSNYFKWKFKDTSINDHNEASVKKNRLGSTEYYVAMTNKHPLQLWAVRNTEPTESDLLLHREKDETERG